MQKPSLFPSLAHTRYAFTPLNNSTTKLRQELILAQTRILELEDRVLAVKTEQADAVALLGQAELVLEEKIAYIIELDRTLNGRIRELEEECDRKSAEIDLRGEALHQAREEDQKNRASRDEIIADLSARLETSNQETNRAHEIAGEVNQQLTQSTEEVARLKEEMLKTTNELSGERENLAELRATIAALKTRNSDCQITLQSTQSSLDDAQSESKSAHEMIRQIRESALWRWSKLWRAWFGPKV